MHTHNPVSAESTASWNPHGFTQGKRVKPINPPAQSSAGAFAVNMAARIKSIWREDGDYMLKLEDESGKEYTGIFFARDFQEVQN